jgi:hypothetical protein
MREFTPEEREMFLDRWEGQLEKMGSQVIIFKSDLELLLAWAREEQP